MSPDSPHYRVVHSLAPNPPHEELSALLSQSPYQEMWMQFVQRRRSPGISIRAVATFMAYELSDAAGREISPNQLKDSVRRALSGEVMTDRIINRFISAFGFSEAETERLWKSVVYHRYLSNSVVTSASEERKEFDRNREYTTLDQTLTFYGDRHGFGKYFDVAETIVSEIDGLEAIKPLFEGYDVKVDLLEGGSIRRIETIHDRAVEDAHNKLLSPIIVPEVPLNKGEIHRIRTRVYVKNTLTEDGRLTNHVGVGASDKPKFNVTTIVRFDEPPQDIRHCIWDDNAYELPIIDEALPQGRTHYSMHYSMIHKAFCGFSWTIVPPEDFEQGQEA